MFANFKHAIENRFTRYTAIDTQSDDNSTEIPSTAKQKNLAKILVAELLEMGIEDAHLDNLGYVYATIPANSDKKNIPVICFCAHLDTSPDCSGENVKAIVHRNYQGQDLILPDDKNIVIKQKEHPDLAHQIGNDIVTASGTTLLGADNKAGITAIMEACHFFSLHKNSPHGEIKILFTPDEEIGRGVDYVDLKKLNADFGYTVDGETLGSIEDETFSADGATLTIFGQSAHPGFAKGKMESALKILSEIISKLAQNQHNPEKTERRDGFIHPVEINGQVEKAVAHFIIRDFEDEKLIEFAEIIKKTSLQVLESYPNSTYSLEIEEQYRNMKKVLDKHPQVTEYGILAIERAGIVAKKQCIRGGTDGTRLSFMGLPCPNIFAGEHAFHGKQEWVSIQDMEKAMQTIVHLACIWEEKS
ncbi:MAG: peptidase T [Sphingobacteriaceae bacterium]|nr:peptidase T [Sphingobacteriaceae bacterium]